MTKNQPLFKAVFIIIILVILIYCNFLAINLFKFRSNDAKRIQDINDLKSALSQRNQMSKGYPVGDYDNLKKEMSFYLQKMPKDPVNYGKYKYVYFSDGKTYYLYTKMESTNSRAIKDGGKYNKKPLYYEVGAGSWKNIIPKNLP